MTYRDAATIVILPFRKSHRFPERYRVYKQGESYYMKVPDLYSPPIPIGYNIPDDFTLKSNDKYEIVFTSKSRLPALKKKKRI